MKKGISVTFLFVFVITAIMSVVVLTKILSLHATGFVVIGNMNKGFYVCLMDAICMLSCLGILFMTHNLIGKNKKGLNILFVVLKCIVTLLTVVVIGFTAFSYKNYRADMTPAFTSPDGEHVIYRAGTDSDIFGNTSGYMHYAIERESCCYDRVFYVYDEDIVPEIIWFEDGFLVKGEGVLPEKDSSTTIRIETVDDGVFVYLK